MPAPITIAHESHSPIRSMLAARFYEAADTWNEARSAWVDSDESFDAVCTGLGGAGAELLFRLTDDEALFRITTRHGDAALSVSVYPGNGYQLAAVGATPDAAQAAMVAARVFIPDRTYADPTAVDVSFWSYDPMMGGNRYVRNLERLPWSDTEDNYPSAVRATLGDMCRWTSAPPTGRLMVFHGPPGTGKSRYLQTLASEWSDWCAVHYVVDPDMMFREASYMTRVMLGEERGDRWRLIVVEDGDEFIDATAKARSGYGVSRLLNIADGLVGQGLRIMVLVSTNVRGARFNKAIVRPGRCAALVEFPPFPAPEAAAWLAAHDVATDDPTGPVTLAGLYAAASGGDYADDADDAEELIG